VLVDLADPWIVAINVVVWFGWSASVGYFAHRLAPTRFESDSVLTRLRRSYRRGGGYERVLRIRSWKDRLPEAGAFFAGGFSKRSIRRSDLERYVIETRRGETVHWFGMALTPAFAIWNPPWAMTLIVLYAVAANVPCLLVLRYNRARVLRVLAVREPTATR
jgi:glycosyl-4,4'-diaponeurosporenoate acyltransferase